MVPPEERERERLLVGRAFGRGGRACGRPSLQLQLAFVTRGTRWWPLGPRGLSEGAPLSLPRQGFGAEDSHVAAALHNLADAARTRRDYDAAEPLYREVRERGSEG